MRMLHYYLALALPAPVLLVATMWTGVAPGSSLRHVGLGLITAILCVATNTLLILFMIVTGRVLKAAQQSRALPRSFLDELNTFFARKSAYPVALLAATSTAATAVLGYGRNIGLPLALHVACGIGIVVFQPWALWLGVRSLRENQRLVDRAVAVLDELDARGTAPPASEEPDARGLGARQRALAFALSAWLPYLYWGLVVWRGDFARLSPAFLILSAAASLGGIVAAFSATAGERDP